MTEKRFDNIVTIIVSLSSWVVDARVFDIISGFLLDEVVLGW
jgi:hypothetical protein